MIAFFTVACFDTEAFDGTEGCTTCGVTAAGALATVTGAGCARSARRTMREKLPGRVSGRLDTSVAYCVALFTGSCGKAALIAAAAAPVASRATAAREQSLPSSNSYEAIRAAVSQGVLPAKGDVRIDEMINAFTYDFAMISTDVNFATAIAGFGQLLHDPQVFGAAGYGPVIALAQANLGPDVSGQRAEAVRIMQQASDLSR